MLDLYTIGHGAQSVGKVVANLKDHDITTLVDVRSIPYSNYKQDWCRENLKPLLENLGIRYVYMGQSLGGKPRSQNYYKNGVLDYETVYQSKSFQIGIEKLLRAATRFKICLLCSEQNPWNCHRSKLIGTYILDRTIRIQHIFPDRTVHPQPQLEPEPSNDLLNELLEES